MEYANPRNTSCPTRQAMGQLLGQMTSQEPGISRIPCKTSRLLLLV